MSALLVLEGFSTLPDIYAEVSTDIVLCEQCLKDVGLTCARKHCAAKRHILLIVNSRRSNLNLHFDDQWHTVFVDCIYPPAIDGLTEAFLDDLVEKNLFGEGSDTDYLKPLLAAAIGRSLLSVPRILRSNLQFVLNTVNYEHEFWVGDAPSSCSHNYRMSLACSPSWLSVFNFYVSKTELFHAGHVKDRAKSGVR